MIPTVDPTHQFSPLISHCIKTQNLKLGKLLHSHFIKTALTLNIFLTNRLVDMYSKCNSLVCAEKAFKDLPTKNTHSWNTMISAYSQVGCFHKARNLFVKMPDPNIISYNSLISSLSHHGFAKESLSVFSGMQKHFNDVFMDGVTLVSVAHSCASLGSLDLLRQVHGVAVVIGLELSVTVSNAMIDAYGKCGDLDDSLIIFNQMAEKDVVSWTSMVVAYARASRLADACRVFDEMPTKNMVSWNALIAGFAQNGRSNEALNYFEQMKEESIQPNSFTYVSVLSACADLALLFKGKQLHGHIIRCNGVSHKFNVFLGNALIDMYCKCGEMKSARTLFEGMPEKDIVSWNSLITGLAQNGKGEESLTVFKNMIEAGTDPNHVTFLGVLSACSHTGLVDEGIRILELMDKDYAVVPRTDHYAILIDLLGRKNNLTEAMELVKRAPNGFNHVGMWGSLLGACRIHGNLDLACKAGAVLFKLEPQNAARLVMLCNIYTAAGKWDDAQRVRVLMETNGLTKRPAYSWIVVRNIRYHFVAKDKLPHETGETYDLLDKLMYHMKDTGYLPSDSNSLFPEDGRLMNNRPYPFTLEEIFSKIPQSSYF